MSVLRLRRVWVQFERSESPIGKYEDGLSVRPIRSRIRQKEHWQLDRSQGQSKGQRPRRPNRKKGLPARVRTEKRSGHLEHSPGKATLNWNKSQLQGFNKLVSISLRLIVGNDLFHKKPYRSSNTTVWLFLFLYPIKFRIIFKKHLSLGLPNHYICGALPTGGAWIFSY